MDITFQQVVKEYRLQQGLSVRAFSEKLTENIPGVSLSGETISKWENKPNRAPDLYFFFNCLTTYTDWRMNFAIDSLKALMPHIFDSGIVTFNIPQAV